MHPIGACSNRNHLMNQLTSLLLFLQPDLIPIRQLRYLDKLHNSTTTLNNYAHFVAFADYENRPSYFNVFKLLELSTNSSVLAGKPLYTIIGTYKNSSFGLQQLMETGVMPAGSCIGSALWQHLAAP